MTTEQFAAIADTRIPTPEEFVAFVHGQGWKIVIRDDGTAALRGASSADELALKLAKMLAREPYRTNVLNVVRAGGCEVQVPDEEHKCQCGTWYCSREQAAALVNASPHFCSQPACCFRTTQTRNG